MVSLVNTQTNATSKRWHLWEIQSRFSLNSTPERSAAAVPVPSRNPCLLHGAQACSLLSFDSISRLWN